MPQAFDIAISVMNASFAFLHSASLTYNTITHEVLNDDKNIINYIIALM